MAGVISSSDGTFNIAGHKSEIGTMRPDIKVTFPGYFNETLRFRFTINVDICSKN
jgi:hypothetical protein